MIVGKQIWEVWWSVVSTVAFDSRLGKGLSVWTQARMLGLNVSMNACLSQYASPCDELATCPRVFPASRPVSAETGPSPLTTRQRISGDGWMDGTEICLYLNYVEYHFCIFDS